MVVIVNMHNCTCWLCPLLCPLALPAQQGQDSWDSRDHPQRLFNKHETYMDKYIYGHGLYIIEACNHQYYYKYCNKYTYYLCILVFLPPAHQLLGQASQAKEAKLPKCVRRALLPCSAHPPAPSARRPLLDNKLKWK